MAFVDVAGFHRHKIDYARLDSYRPKITTAFGGRNDSSQFVITRSHAVLCSPCSDNSFETPEFMEIRPAEPVTQPLAILIRREKKTRAVQAVPIFPGGAEMFVPPDGGCFDVYIDGGYAGNTCDSTDETTPQRNTGNAANKGGLLRLSQQQRQCLQNEINYANRSRSDTLNSAVDAIGKSAAIGMTTGAARGAYAGFVGGEIIGGIETGGLSGVPGAVAGAGIGGGIGGMYGVGTGVVHAIWTKVHYDYNLPFLRSTYVTNLEKNVQQNCSISVKLQ